MAELGRHAGKHGRHAGSRGIAPNRHPDRVHRGPGLRVSSRVPATVHGEQGLQQHPDIDLRCRPPQHAVLGRRRRGSAAGSEEVGEESVRVLPVLQSCSGLRVLALQRHLPREGAGLVLQRVLHPELPAAGRPRRSRAPQGPQVQPELLRRSNGSGNPLTL